MRRTSWVVVTLRRIWNFIWKTSKAEVSNSTDGVIDMSGMFDKKKRKS